MAYIPSLKDLPSTPTPSSVTSGADTSYTPSLADLPNQDKPTSTLSKVTAAASNFLNGEADAGAAIGNLATNILKGGAHLIYGKLLHNPEIEKDVVEGINTGSEKVGALYNKLRESTIAPTPEESKAISENPKLSGVAGALGNISGLVAGGNTLARPINAITEPLASAAPVLAKSPMMAGTLNSTAQNSIIGAAADPENPVLGAVTGGLTGAVTHGVTGAAGYKVTKAGTIIDQEIKNRQVAGIDAYDHHAIEDIQASLKSEGLNLRKVEIKNAVQNQAKEVISQLRPDKYNPKESPINYVSKLASTNLPAEIENSKALYAPINASTTLLPKTNFTDALSKIKPSVIDKLSMPDVAPPTMTLNQMLEYRQQFDATLNQAKSLTRNGKLNNTDLVPLYQARQALNEDIHSGAASVKLEPQLQAAEDHYNNVIRPFQVYDKNLNQIKQMNPEEVQGKVWKDLNKQLQARFPDPNKIKTIAKTLGDDGKEIVGWAKIENDMRQSTVDGIFNPTTFGTRIAKSENSGLNSMIMTDEQREAVQGLQKLGKATRLISPKSPDQSGTLTKIIQHLTYNRMGIQLLKVIGSPTTTAKDVRTIAQQLLEGTLAIGQVQSSKQQQQ